MLVGYVKFGWEGVWPKEQAWGNSHEKAFDGSGEGHLLPVLLSFDPPSTRRGCFKARDGLICLYDVLHRAGA